MQRKNSISIEDAYRAEAENRSFLGYAGLILLLVGAVLFFATFVMSSGGPRLPSAPRSFGSASSAEPDPSDSALASAPVSNGW